MQCSFAVLCGWYKTITWPTTQAEKHNNRILSTALMWKPKLLKHSFDWVSAVYTCYDVNCSLIELISTKIVTFFSSLLLYTRWLLYKTLKWTSIYVVTATVIYKETWIMQKWIAALCAVRHRCSQQQEIWA